MKICFTIIPKRTRQNNSEVGREYTSLNFPKVKVKKEMEVGKKERKKTKTTGQYPTESKEPI